MKNFFKVLVRVMLVILLLIVVALAAFVVRWAVSQKTASDFLPNRHTLRIQSPNLGRIYSEWLNLEAADIVLNTRQMGGIRTLLRDLRATGTSESPLLRSLLEVPFVFVLAPDGFVANFDLGWRSIFTHFLPWFGAALPMEGLTLISGGGFQYFRFQSGESEFYLALLENLALVSDRESLLREALNNGMAPTAAPAPPSRAKKLFTSSYSTIKILADTPALLASARASDAGMANILRMFSLPEESVVSVGITNDNILLEASTRVEANTPEADKILRFSTGTSVLWGAVPDNVSLWATLNAARFEDLLALLTSNDEELRATIASAEATAQTLLGAGLSELLFRWTSGEASVFYLPTSSEPTIAVRIQDPGAFARAFQYLENSIFLRPADRFEVDKIPINRMALPPFFEAILGLLGQNLQLPYYMVRDNVLFLSTDSDNLVKVVNAQLLRQTFDNNPDLKRIRDRLPSDPKLFVYYDLRQQVPFFLRDQALVTRLLRLYQQGVLGVYIRDRDIDLKLSAHRVTQGGVLSTPGFPRQAQGRITSPVYVLQPEGGGSPVLAYIADSNRLVVDSVFEEELWTAEAPGARHLLPQFGPRGARWLWGSDAAGKVYRWSLQAGNLSPFPVHAGSPISVPPVVWNNNLVVILDNAFRAATISPDGSVIPWDHVFSDALVYPPSFRERRWAFYPRAFLGDIAVLDESGNLLGGETISVDGLGAANPVWLRALGDLRLYFLTVDGRLKAWGSDNLSAEGFPVQVSGVYQAPPLVLKSRGGLEILALLSEEGRLTLVSPEGVILREAIVEGAGREARMISANIDGSALDQILIYGGSDRIHVLTQDLRPLPGFPQPGYTQPSILDLNGDRRPEIVTAGVDDQIYSWSWQP